MWENLHKLRSKTSLFLIPPEEYSRQEVIASRFSNVVVVDWLRTTLETANPSSRFLNTSVEKEISRIRQIVNSDDQVFGFINNEYFLARFTLNEKSQFWQSLLNGFVHMKGVGLFFVLNTPELLPDKLNLDKWKENERFFSLEDVPQELN